MAESKIATVKHLTTIAMLVSLTIGIVVSVDQLYETMSAARGTLNALRLQALKQVTGFLDNNSAVRQDLAGYLHGGLKRDEALVQERIAAGTTGEEIYYSKELEIYRRATDYYERLGAVIDLKYLDFDIVFEVIAFPDDFWEETAPMRKLLKENWEGKGHPLRDFQSSFRSLCLRYQKERARLHLDSASKMKCDV